jgi:hypothetical protein
MAQAVSQRPLTAEAWVRFHSDPQWPRCLRRGFAAVRLLGLWVRIPPGAWMFVLCLLYKDSSMEHKWHEEGRKDVKVKIGSKERNGTGKKIPGQSMWGLWWTNWHWDRFFSEFSVFPCQFNSTGAPLIVKLGKKKPLIFITGVAQEALRLRCVRSICCGALYHGK